MNDTDEDDDRRQEKQKETEIERRKKQTERKNRERDKDTINISSPERLETTHFKPICYNDDRPKRKTKMERRMNKVKDN